VRWLVNVPAILLCLAVLERAQDKGLVERCFVGSLAVILLANAALLWFSSGADRQFYAIASIQIMLFGFVLLGLRFRVAFPCVVACFGATAFTALALEVLDAPANVLGSAYLTPVLVFFGLAFAAYIIDVSSRAAFLAGRERDAELQKRLALETERRRWVQGGKDYLNHEIKNALLGISSSLSLLGRRNDDTGLADYIERAQTSTEFMKRLLADVSASTDLDAALAVIELRATDLTRLLANRTAEYREIYPDQPFSVELAEAVQVDCDADRIVQLLDKLTDNAVTHSDGTHAVEIRLTADGASAHLDIVNVGDLLVDDAGDIFEPFVSSRAAGDDSGFGLGLYIAKRIAEAHRGRILAHAIAQPPGARFSVSLPLSKG